ncbi:MAG TPA: hypothetical protein VHD32_02765 [Candidatus Didemnitutus sp.]|nr:hypothetical protein [Candidatus Didemnitutus sp.]
MNWNDYQAAWKRQPLPVGTHADLSNLKATFDRKRQIFYGGLAVRDFAESAAGLLVMVAMFAMWWKLGRDGWPIGFAEILTGGVVAAFIRERRRVAKSRLGPEAPMIEKVDAYLNELRHQRRLVGAIFFWYLAPLATAIFTVHFTLVFHAKPWEPQRDLWFNVVFMAFYFACFALVVWINRHAVKTRLNPRVDELEKLRASLLSPT